MRMTRHWLLLGLLFWPIGLFGADQEPVVSLVWFPRFSPNNQWLATAHGSWDGKQAGEVRVWDAATGELRQIIKQRRGIRAVAFSPDSQRLAAGGYGAILSVWDPATGVPIKEWKVPGFIENLVFHPDGQQLVSSHSDGSIRLWKFETGRANQKIGAVHKGEIWGMTISPDGKLAATAGQDGRACLTDLTQGVVRHRFALQGCNGVAFTSDSKRVAIGCTDSIIRIYDVESGTELHTLKGHIGRNVTDLQFAADDALLVSAGFDQTVRIWELPEGTPPQLKETLSLHQKAVFGVALSPDGQLLASGGWDDQIHVWDAKSFAEKWSWSRASEAK